MLLECCGSAVGQLPGKACGACVYLNGGGFLMLELAVVQVPCCALSAVDNPSAVALSEKPGPSSARWEQSEHYVGFLLIKGLRQGTFFLLGRLLILVRHQTPRKLPRH